MTQREHSEGTQFNSTNMSCLSFLKYAVRRWVVAADGDAARKEAEKKFPGKVKGLSQVRAIYHEDRQGMICDQIYPAV